MEYGTKMTKETPNKIIKRLNNDYFKEGQIQHHCVRTYLDKYKSIIISVRKNHENGMERMTCEFVSNSEITNMRHLKDYSNTPTMVQARMKYNNDPTGDWEVVMKVLRKEFCISLQTIVFSSSDT